MTAAEWRSPITVSVELGTAELIPDPKRPTGWALFVDGVAQSYVDLADPLYLEFSYVRRVTTAVDAFRPEGVPLDVLHLGGGALCLPRYVAATRPGSRQHVVERDATLADLVARELPLPPGLDVSISIEPARAAMERAKTGSYDLVISDVFQAARMPDEVATSEFAGLVATALRPDGLYVVNVTDMPALAFTKRLAATLRERFAEVCVVADAPMLRGRRFGNAVLVAAQRADLIPMERLTIPRTGESTLVGLLSGPDLTAFIAGARPMLDSDTAPDGHRPTADGDGGG